MEFYILTLASTEIILSLFMGLITISITLVAAQKMILRESIVNHLLEQNTAVSIFVGALIFSVLIIVIGSIEPAINYLQMKMANTGGKLTFSLLAFAFGQFVVFYIIAFVICFITVGTSLAIGFALTRRLGEIYQINSGNIAIAVLLSLKLVAFAYFIQPATKHFMASLVNYELTQDEIRHTQ